LAIAVGFQLSGLLPLSRHERSLVRSVVDGNVRPSRRIGVVKTLMRVGGATAHPRYRVAGALFFASAER
jgi:hypothetical protein